MLIDSKIVISGEYYEVFNYSSPIVCNTSLFGNAKSFSRNVNFRRLVCSNLYRWFVPGSTRPFLPIFLTLTFRDQTIPLDRAIRLYRSFQRRLAHYVRDKSETSPKYVAVVEFTQKGVPHFHVLFFNLPFITVDKFSLLWRHGYCYVTKSKGRDAQKTAAYMAKYMGKRFDIPGDDKMKYYYSTGLLRPFAIASPGLVEHFLHMAKPYAIKLASYSYRMRSGIGDVEYGLYRSSDDDFPISCISSYFQGGLSTGELLQKLTDCVS